jgi:hypothetical protein
VIFSQRFRPFIAKRAGLKTQLCLKDHVLFLVLKVAETFVSKGK